MSGRPRKSTLVISGLFVAVLAIYILFRPIPQSEKADTGSTKAQPTSSPTSSPRPSLRSPTPTRSPSPTRSASVSPSATPSGSVTPTASPTPTGSLNTAPPVLNPLPTTTGSPTP